MAHDDAVVNRTEAPQSSIAKWSPWLVALATPILLALDGGRPTGIAEWLAILACMGIAFVITRLAVWLVERSARRWLGRG